MGDQQSSATAGLLAYRPTLFSVDPAQVIRDTEISISGKHFGNHSEPSSIKILVGGSTCYDAAWLSDDKISCRVGVLSAQVNAISVTIDGVAASQTISLGYLTPHIENVTIAVESSCTLDSAGRIEGCAPAAGDNITLAVGNFDTFVVSKYSSGVWLCVCATTLLHHSYVTKRRRID